MENKKMKRIPFDLELAKAITAGEKERISIYMLF